jgi:hypothetical protein
MKYLLFLLLLPLPAYGQAAILPGRLSFQVGLGPAFVVGGDTYRTAYDRGIDFNLGIGYMLRPNVDIVGRFTSTRIYLEAAGENVVSGGDLAIRGLSAGVRTHLYIGSRLFPYIHVFGGGFSSRVKPVEGNGGETGAIPEPHSEVRPGLTIGSGITYNVQYGASIGVGVELTSVFLQDEAVTFIPVGIQVSYAP